MGKTKKRLILIDGNAIMHRAFHALPPLTTKSGELVNAVYGFSSTLLSVIEKFKPEYMVVTFDLPGPTFRHKQYDQYKATRQKAPDEFYQQIPKVKEVVRAFNIPIYEKESFEADDVIGTLAEQMEKIDSEAETIIVTGDLDALQLVTDKTRVYTMRRGLSDAVLYDIGRVKERYDLSPEQMIDFKGLSGDASDNIPGVKGVGEKTATNLLKEYETVEGVYENIEKIKGATRDKLEKDRSQALLSKQLATISKKVPVKMDTEKARVSDFNRASIVELFGKLNFFSLVKRLPKSDSVSEIAPRETGKRIRGVREVKYDSFSGKELEDFIKETKNYKEVSIALDGEKNKINGIAFSWENGRANYIPFEKNNKGKVKEIIENEKIKKVGFDLKSIYKPLKENGIVMMGIGFDVMLAAYVLNPGEKVEIEKMVLSELGEEIEIEEQKGQMEIGSVTVGNIIKKNCQRADYSLKLKNVLQKKLSKISKEQEENGKTGRTLLSVFKEIEMPLITILAEMELAGIKINSLILKGISETIEKKIKNLEKSIYKLAKDEFNINSPQQLSEILFVKMNLPTDDIKKTKTGFSTAATELDKLRKESKIIEKIEEYRELSKLKNTYLDTLPLLIDEKSRIHTSFNQAVTATGRLSSSDPNLQNIPIRTDLGQLLRTAFVAEDKHRLISADYSQIDLRSIAHVSEDKKLIEAFVRGDDIHKITAAEINKVPLSQVTEKMRRSAKALNFGVIYGMSVFGFSQSAGIEREEAKIFIDEYMRKFSGVAEHIKRTKEFAKDYEYVETLLGRRRNIPEINSPNFQVAQGAERMAINMPIQGLAADIMKLAMIEAEKVVNEYEGKVKTVLQIHDELIFEAEEAVAEECSKKVKKAMEGVYKLKVPLVVDVKVGENWGEI